MSKVLDNLEKIDSSYIQNFPNSRKIYIQGSRADIQVPMREITLSPTAKSDGSIEENPPLHVYDTSGVYTDPNVTIDLHQGLKPIRAKWIEERNDTEQLADFSSIYFHKRHDDKELNALRFPNLKKPRRAMKGKNITPFAFAAKDAWAPMGTFDVLNMRLNGYDFHMELCQGKQKWDSPEVRNVFATWKTLLPYQQENSLGRTWQEAATSMANGECGMYLLGTFVVDGVPPEAAADLDFFTFPALDDTIGNDALDAPIDGFCVSGSSENQEPAKAFAKWLGSAEAADAANNNASAPFIAANSGASTEKYGELQKKSAELVQNAKSIAQFLDRDTNADLANTVITASLQEFIKNPDNIDSITTSIQQQAASILG